jgi:predicted RNA-binding protein with PUA-like domain
MAGSRDALRGNLFCLGVAAVGDFSPFRGVSQLRASWLMKSEPSVYSIDDLKRDGSTCWEGVRNFQARNLLRDQMKVGDLVLFYHSNAEPSGVAGISRVIRTGYPDFTAWDKKDIHYDPKSSKENPTWYMVDIGFEEKFKHFVTLEELKADHRFEGMKVVQRGCRLSVQPVESKHFERVCSMGRKN